MVAMTKNDNWLDSTNLSHKIYSYRFLFSKRIICLEDNNTIVARTRINQKQDPSYRKAHWIYTTKNETYARKHNCFYLRMDTNEINQVV